jgi:flagellar biosynthesis protein FlhF
MVNENNFLQKQTVIGDSMGDALKKAKAQYGDEIEVLSSKTFKDKNKTRYELNILLNESMAKSTSQTNSLKKSNENNIIHSLKEDMKEITKLVEESGGLDGGLKKQPIPLMKKIQKVPANNNLIKDVQHTNKISNNNLEEKLKNLGNEMNIIKNILWDRDGYHKNGFEVPPEFSEVFNALKFSHMKRKHIDFLMMQSNKLMPTKMKTKAENVKRYFETLTKNIIQVKPETSINAKKKIQMLVGPTGVGKTTTLAKLAARYSFDYSKGYAVRNKTVGIITLDNFKIGAIDQLKIYAQHMQLDIKVVINPMEFVKALQELNSCDYIFIDTAGSSQYDKQKIVALKKYLLEDDEIDINVSLVLPVNLTKEVFDDIYEGFNMLNIDDIILTKLDETKYYGAIFSFLFDTKKPLTYFSYGQNIPDDIMVADKNFIVEKLFSFLPKMASDKNK